MRIHRRTIPLLALVVALLGSPGCGARGAVATNPTADQTQQVRVLAVRIADATTAGLTILHETGELLDTLPLAASTKDAYDCAIVKVTGTTTPASATVTAICGAVPLVADAPLPKALTALKGVATCPGLSTTVASLTGVVSPLIQQLETSPSAALKMAGLSLRATFAVLSLGGTQTCSD